MTKRSRNIKAALALVMVGALVVVISVFVMYRRGADEVRDMIASVQPGADISISSVQHVATRDGKTEWRLNADSAFLMDQKKEAVFESPSITFFTENRQQVHLTALEGSVMTDSNDIEVHGDVVLKSDEYRMETQKLNYQHEKRVFSANVPVHINGSEFDLQADSVSFDLKKNQAVFQGHVKGSFGEGISL